MPLREIKVNVSVADSSLLPTHAYPSDAGFDFRIRAFGDVYSSTSPEGCPMLDTVDKVMLRPMERVLVKTGVKMALPEGYELQIRPKSGLALKKGISIVNSPGTIDCSYRGEIGIIIINLGHLDFHLKKGMKIAQGVIAPHMTLVPHVVASLEVTERGQGGFGSTGT